MADIKKGMKPAKLGVDFIKRTAGLIGGAAGDYIKECMPVTYDIVDDARSTVSSVNTKLKQTSQSVFGKVRGMKNQQPLRALLSWYMRKEDEFSGFDSSFNEIESNLSFDTDTSSSDSTMELAQTQINETEAASNKISKTVVETAAKTVEANMQLTGNILSAIDNQTAVITSGFEKTSDILNKILEVVTKNTSMLVTTSQASGSGSSNDPVAALLKNGKFDLKNYLKAVGGNVKSSEFGMILSVLEPFLNPTTAKSFLKPEFLVSMAFSSFVDKRNPNLKKNLKAVDDALNDTIMNSLIRLGESNATGFGGTIAKLLGINAGRKEYSGGMASLELKAIPFDTMTKEAVTHAIPGYLKRILVQLGGESVDYDYKARSFKTGVQTRKDFMQAATSRNVMQRAGSNVRRVFGDDEWGNMMYDMMYADLSDKMTKAYGEKLSKARSTIGSFQNAGGFTAYAQDLYQRSGLKMSQGELQRLEQISKNLVTAMQGGVGSDIIMNMQRENVRRNERMDAYVRDQELYGRDLRGLSTSIADEIREILDDTGRKKLTNHGDIGGATVSNSSLFGVNYTNKALYEIYRMLDRGINVFQTGSASTQQEAYKKRGDSFLPPPKGLQIRRVTERSFNNNTLNPTGILGNSEFTDQANFLTEEGSTEDRLKNWTKGSYGNLKNAVLSGSPEQVRAAFGKMFTDVAEVGTNKIKESFGKMNKSFGNVTGFLKHKFLGDEYSYEDEEGKVHHVKKNKNGGILGFVGESFKQSFGGAKKYAKHWFDQVKGYFDYNDPDDTTDIKSKRKKFISTSVGALAGAGLLGGPIGLILGGVAGSALSGLNVGKKIKDVLFGRDPKTGKAKGALTKLSDAIVDPIKFQIGKTAHLFGNLIKKNLIGPLSNIGAAIKERIKNAADTHFGFVFKAIGKVLLAPFKLVGNLAKLPFQVLGSLVRGAGYAGAGLVGGGLNSIAKSIAGRKGRDVIDERIQQQRQDYKNDQKWEIDEEGNYLNGEDGRDKVYNKWRSYRAWRKQEHLRKAELQNRFNEFTREEEYTEAEWNAKLAEEAKKQTELSQKIEGEVSDLAEAGLKKDSIFTHDTIVHQQLNQIIELIGGRAHFGERGSLGTAESLTQERDMLLANASRFDAIANKEGQSEAIRNKALAAAGSNRSAADIVSSELGLEQLLGKAYFNKKKADEADEGTSDAIVGAAGAVIAASGDVDSTETKEMMGVVDEASKENSDPNKQKRGLARIFDNAKKKAEVAKEKTSSIFDKLSNLFGNNGILSTLGNILKYGSIIAGALTILPGLISVGKDIYEWVQNHLNIKEAVDGIWSWVKGFFGDGDKGNKDESTTVQGFDQVTAWADVVTGGNPINAYLNPFGNLYHNAKDSNGNYIKNISATKAKELAYTGSFKNSLRGLIKDWGNTVGYQQAVNALSPQYSEALKNYQSATSLAEMTNNVYDINNAVDAANKLKPLETEMNARQAQLAESQEALGKSKDKVKSVGKNIVNNATYLGSGMLLAGAAGSGVDWLVTNTSKKILQATPFSESTAETISEGLGDFGGRFTTAKVMKDVMKDMTKDASKRTTMAGKAATKMGETATKIIEGFKKLLEKLLNKMKSSKLFKGIAEKVGKVFEKLKSTISTWVSSQAENSRLFTLFRDKAGSAGVKGQGQWLAAIPTLTAALVGEIEGLTNYQYLFGVSPDTVDYDMMQIATIWDGVVNAGEWSALWPGILFLDVADTIVSGLGMLEDEAGGKRLTISQFICRQIYILFKGAGGVTKLSGATLALDTQLAAYNTEHEGATLNASQYNDLINGQGWFNKLIYGSNITKRTGANGEEYYDVLTDEEEEHNYEGISGHLKATRDLAKEAWGGIKSGGKWLWEKATDFSDYMAQGVKDLGTLVSDGASWAGEKISDGFNWVKDKLNTAGEAYSGVAEIVGDKVSEGLGWVKDKLSDAGEAYSGAAEIIGEKISEFGSGVWEKVKGFGDYMAQGVEDLGTLLGGAASSAWEALKGLGSKIGNGVKEFVVGNDEDEYSGVVGHLKAAKDLVSEGASWVGDKVGDFFSWLGFGGPNNLSTPNVPWQNITNNYYGMGGPEDNPLSKKAMITSPFGKRTFPKKDEHKGIDLVPADGSGEAAVASTAIGTVSYVKNNVPDTDTVRRDARGGFKYYGSNSGGNQVWIDTDDGRRIKSMHLKAGSIPNTIQTGTKVVVGTPIGEVGSTGWSTGPHLHYQVEDRYGRAINPGFAYQQGAGGIGGLPYSNEYYDQLQNDALSMLTGNTTGYYGSLPGLSLATGLLPSTTTSSTANKVTVVNVDGSGMATLSDGTRMLMTDWIKQQQASSAEVSSSGKKTLSSADIMRLQYNIDHYGSKEMKEFNKQILDGIEEQTGLRPTIKDIIHMNDDSDVADTSDTTGVSDNFTGDYTDYTEPEEEKGILAQIVDKLKSMGQGFVDFITGGLFGEALKDKNAQVKDYLSSQIVSASDLGSGVGGTNLDRFIAVFLNGKDSKGRDKWSYYPGCAADRFIDMCEQEMGTTERNYDNVTPYTKWYYGSSTSASEYGAWCMIYVQWCFNNAGIPLKYKTASCDSYLNYAKKNGLLRTPPKKGDMVLFHFSTGHAGANHVAIFEEKTSKGVLCVEGNIVNFNNEFNKASELNNGKGPMGGAVAKRYTTESDVLGYARPVDFDKIDKIIKEAVTKFKSAAEITGIDTETGEVTSYASSGLSGDLDRNAVWRFFRSKGYSAEQTAGLLGSMMAESGVSLSAKNAACVEGVGDHSTDVELNRIWKDRGWDNPDKLLDDREGMDAYTKRLWSVYESAGHDIRYNGYSEKGENDTYSKNNHSGGTGHLYPGLGFAQWTGPRAKALLQNSKKKGIHWYDPQSQLDFIVEEAKTRGGSVSAYDRMMNTNSPGDASDVWSWYYEGYSGSKSAGNSFDAQKQTEGYKKRRKYAEELYQAYLNGELGVVPNSGAKTPGLYKGKYETYDVYPWMDGWDKKSDDYKNLWHYEHSTGLPIDEEEWTNMASHQPDWDKWISSEYLTRYNGAARGASNIKSVSDWYKFLNPGKEFYGYGGSTNDPYVPFIGSDKDSWYGSAKIGSSGDVVDIRRNMSNNIPKKSTFDAKKLLKKYGMGGPEISSAGYSYSSHVSPGRSSYDTDSIVSYTGGSSILASRSISSKSPSGTDLSGVIQAIEVVIRQLAAINNNTATSNDYLDSINNKEFVDQGLRNSLNSLKSVSSRRKTSASSVTPRTASTRGVNALILG